MNNVILIREGFKNYNFARMILYTWNGDRMVLFPLTSIREGFNKENISYCSITFFWREKKVFFPWKLYR